MSIALDNFDLAILCSLLDREWVTLPVLFGSDLHGQFRQKAMDACRYRLGELESEGLVFSRRAMTIKKRIEYSINKQRVSRDSVVEVRFSNGQSSVLRNVLIVDNDIYSHEHENK